MHQELAQSTMPLAQAVYNDSGAPAGWERLSPEQLKQEHPIFNDVNFHDSTTGFHADIFKNEDGEVVLSMRGTNELIDWGQNFDQGF